MSHDHHYCKLCRFYSRTIGVLTKLDRVEKGTESEFHALALNEASGAVLGDACSVVRCRSADEQAKTLAEMAAVEETFFKGDLFNGLDPSMLGVRNLSTRLTNMFSARIRAYLPTLTAKARLLQAETKEALAAMAPPAPTTAYQKQQKVFTTVMQMCDAFAEEVNDDNQIWKTYRNTMNWKVHATKPDFSSDKVMLKVEKDSYCNNDQIEGLQDDMTISVSDFDAFAAQKNGFRAAKKGRTSSEVPSAYQYEALYMGVTAQCPNHMRSCITVEDVLTGVDASGSIQKLA
jgi:hypothetical protein